MDKNPFYTSIAGYYERIFPLKPETVRFVHSCLPNQTGETEILDIGCSTGQLATALAGLGYDVTGIDLDEEMIRIAKSKHKEHENPEFLTGNMLSLRESTQNRLFDGILCFGNTIPHLPDENTILLFFREAFHSLKNNGIFMLQTVNYSMILKKSKYAFPVIDNETIRFERAYQFRPDSTNIYFITKLLDKANRHIITNSVQLFPLAHETAEHMLNEAGFRHIQLYGNFEKTPFREDSPAMVITAEKD